jgi:hypothetical protein
MQSAEGTSKAMEMAVIMAKAIPIMIVTREWQVQHSLFLCVVHLFDAYIPFLPQRKRQLRILKMLL